MNRSGMKGNRRVSRALGVGAASALCLALRGAPAWAQSDELLRAYQKLDAARSANKTDEVLKWGDQAVALTDAGGDKAQEIRLLQSLAETAATAGRTALAIKYYQRAAALEATLMGEDGPGLVPILAPMADIQLKAGNYTEAAATEQRILAIEKAAHGDHHENVAATLGKLKVIYLAANDPAAAARTDSELRDVTAPAASRGLPTFNSNPGRRYQQKEGFATVKVFYGTTRAATGELKPASFYGKARGDLQYGYVNVTIPEIHQEAELETQPRWIDFVIGVDPTQLRRRYVLLDGVTPLPRDQFAKALHQDVAASPSHEVLVFVHGFNNTFEDASRRAAQLAYDLDFDGTPVLYSWPSQGDPTAYTMDEAAVNVSGRKMADFLETVMADSGATRVHLLAHSMGNRALIEALQTYLARRAPDKRQHLFGQIVFTAPDVDRDYFVDAMDSLRSSAERVTLYASSRDYALRLSQFVHGAPRAGTAGEVIVRLAGLDTIDMSSVPADLLGHSYFAANSGTIYDVFRLLWKGEPPPQRCGMSDRKSANSLPVWSFDANQCKGDAMLEAGWLLKRFGDLAQERAAATFASLTDPSQKKDWEQIIQRLNGLLTAPTPASAGGTK